MASTFFLQRCETVKSFILKVIREDRDIGATGSIATGDECLFAT